MATPPPPPGFVLEQNPQAMPPPPPGFVLEGQAAPSGPSFAQQQGAANAAQQRAPQPQTYNDSYVSQGLSGLNEGLANFAGSPVDLATAGVNAGIGLTNRAAGTNFDTIKKPVLGSDQIKEALSSIGAIGPRTKDRKKQVVRRVAQGVGEAVPFAAGGIGGARALASGLGSGVGGAIGQQVAPDNPAAEAIGSILGGLSPAAIETVATKISAARAAKAATPTTEALFDNASDLYAKAEKNGFTAQGGHTKGIHTTLRKIATDEGLVTPKSDEILDTMPKVKAVLRMTDEFAGSPMTPTQMQNVRKTLQNAARSADGSEARVGSMMLEKYDDFVSGFAPEFKQARNFYHRAKKAELLELASERARERAGGFNASGYENALRSEYRALAIKINDGKLKGFTPKELEAIRKVSRGDLASNSARMVGRLAPKGPVSLVPTIAGGAAAGPLGAAGVAGLGYGGRALATHLAIDAANTAELLVRAGVSPAKVKALSPQQLEALAAVLSVQLTQAATSSAPDNEPPKP